MRTFSILALSNGKGPELGPEFTVTTVALRDAESPEEFDAVILDDPVSIANLRADLKTVSTPIFATQQMPADGPLVDGILPDDLKAVLEGARERRKAEAMNGAVDTVEAAILTYLWRLEGRRLTPIVDLGRSDIYTYPLLTALGVQDQSDWLVRAERQGLIEVDKVIDRTRNCGSCSGAHLNYVDRCPYCDALDIFAEQAIHCFTCGLVAEHGTFRRGERLVCPKCETALKHIGTDYDRPIERMRCGSCGERFNDARVKAVCLECGTINAQADLQSRSYHAYRIGPQGESLLRTGNKPADRVQAFGEAIGHEQFLWTLSWMNALGPQGSVLAKIDIHGAQAVSDEERARDRSLRDQISTLLTPTEILHFHDLETMLVLYPEQGEARTSEMAEQLKALADSQVSSSHSLSIEAVQLPMPQIASDARAWLERFLKLGN